MHEAITDDYILNPTCRTCRRRDIPVEVVTIDKYETFLNFEEALKVHPDLDLFHNGKQFTWAIEGHGPNGVILARFESWELYLQGRGSTHRVIVGK